MRNNKNDDTAEGPAPHGVYNSFLKNKPSLLPANYFHIFFVSITGAIAFTRFL